jgi:hypothetical protein
MTVIADGFLIAQSPIAEVADQFFSRKIVESTKRAVDHDEAKVNVENCDRIG